ncbi:MAG: acyltransferase family protein, partial [Betaproteobacteria bacterium]
PYLWTYTALLWLVLKRWPGALDLLAAYAARHLTGLRVWLLPVLAITCVRIALFERFPSTHALLGDWFNHAMYFGMFVAGAVFARMPNIWDELERLRWPSLIAALACWTVVVIHHDGAAGPLLQAFIVATLQWGALMAALGFARRRLNFDHPWCHRLTEAVFPVYILHQTFIIGLTQALAPLHWRPLIEGPVLLTMTFILSYAGYEAVRRHGPLRPWFGLSRQTVKP